MTAGVVGARLERWIRYRRGDTGRHARDLLRLEWAPPSEVAADQRRRLSALLTHAARHVPYYREVLSERGVLDERGRLDLGRFGQLPLLDKGMIRARFDDLVSDDLAGRRWSYCSSSGSTGEPLRLIEDERHSDWLRAMPILCDSLIGRRVGERRLFLWGSWREVVAGRESRRMRLGRRLRREAWLNTFRMSPRHMAQYVQTMNDFRPEHITAYAESAVDLARFIERTGRQVHSPKTLATSAGTLEPSMRALLERVFRCAVFNQYGSIEVGGIANECDRHEGLHVTMPGVIVEILRPDGTAAAPGELGEIVLTSLFDYALPRIRYRIGDVGSWAERACSCGRSWPLLASVAGRISSTFVTADGILVAGEAINWAFHLQDWIAQWQAVQETVDHVLVKIVPRTDIADPLARRRLGVEEIARSIRLALGEGCTVSFEFVDDIEPSPSGKRMFTLSKVPGGFSPGSDA